MTVIVDFNFNPLITVTNTSCYKNPTNVKHPIINFIIIFVTLVTVVYVDGTVGCSNNVNSWWHIFVFYIHRLFLQLCLYLINFYIHCIGPSIKNI